MRREDSIAHELLAVARALIAQRPPRMKHRWQDITVGDKFKFKGKKYLKVGKYKAVLLKDILSMGGRTDGSYEYEYIK